MNKKQEKRFKEIIIQRLYAVRERIDGQANEDDVPYNVRSELRSISLHIEEIYDSFIDVINEVEED